MLWAHLVLPKRPYSDPEQPASLSSSGRALLFNTRAIRIQSPDPTLCSYDLQMGA
jgi:hypothetical protein